MTDGLSPETLAAQALGTIDPASGAVSPPIHPSTIYARDADGSSPAGLAYTRADNPTWEITDLRAVAEVARAADIRLVVDSTIATTVLTRPIEFGADLVVHSATKYLNGHSDVLAGAIVTAQRDPFWERIRSWRRDSGCVPGPFEAWLLQRGVVMLEASGSPGAVLPVIPQIERLLRTAVRQVSEVRVLWAGVSPGTDREGDLDTRLKRYDSVGRHRFLREHLGIDELPVLGLEIRLGDPTGH